MLPEHHIQFIALETEKTVQINYLEPGEEPAAEFRVGSDKPVAVYEYCNLHGLWAADL
jgi:superoxide reductase